MAVKTVAPKPAAPTAAPVKAAAPPASAAPAFASNLPEDMLAGGLVDDFDGLILKARYVPWDYNGNLDHHILAVALTIRPDGEEPFVQHYSAGDLENFVPAAIDGTPVDLENGEGEALEGVGALRVGKKEQMSNSSNWASFISAALDAGGDAFRSRVTPLLTFIEGTYAHFNRVPQKKRSGIVSQAAADPNKKRNNDILVITEFKGFKEGNLAASATPKNTAPITKPKPVPGKAATAASTPAPAAPAAGDLATRLENLILDQIIAVEGAPIEKSVVTGAIMKAFAGVEKAKALAMLNDTGFLANAASFSFDPETSAFSLAE